MEPDTPMSRLLNLRCSRAWPLLLGFFLVSLLNDTYAAPVSFRRAVELAAKHSAEAAPEKNLAKSDPVCIHSNEPFVPHVCVAFSNSSELQEALTCADLINIQQPLNEPVLSPLQRTAYSKRQPGKSLVSRDHGSATLITAIAYVQLEWVGLQLKVLEQEHETAARMVAIEKLRVVVGVDEDVSLIRARLLEAQSRARAALLGSEEIELRDDLAYLTGLPEDQIEPIPGSVPPLRVDVGLSASGPTIQPQRYIVMLQLQASVKELTAVRDAAQLTYLLAERDAIRAAGLGTPTLRKELESRVSADDKFFALLDASCELQMAQIGLLESTGQFDNWAVSAETDELALLPRHSEDTRVTMTHTRKYDTSFSRIAVAQSSVRTILILPSNDSLMARQCRQLAAVSIGDGGGKDATSVVRWSSSNESVAIVSSSGLITGLRPGHVTISASLAGVLRFRPITVGEEEPTLKK